MNSSDQPSSPRRPGRIKRLIAWSGRTIQALHPGRRAWRGAAIGAAVTAIAILTLLAATAQTGLSVWAESLIGLAIGLLGVLLFGLLVAGLAALFRTVPKLVIGAVLGSIVAVAAIPAIIGGGGVDILPILFGPVILLEAFFGCALAAVVGGGLKGARLLTKFAAFTSLLLALSLNVYLVATLASEGSTAHLVHFQPSGHPAIATVNAPDPSIAGPFQVKTLFYGSGTDKRRHEYSDEVTIKTETVDASLLLPDLKGFKASMRQRFWGFGPKQFPINGRVWFPAGDGPFPLVLIVHGNHSMEEFSDPGYAYLGELLASRGFVLASVDENFLNGSWSGDLGGKELPARAWFLLQHLKAWSEWNKQEANPFYHKVDLNNIALIGHSRGGEAAALAAQFNKLSHYPEDGNLKFDFNFPIKSVIAIAPSDGFYEPAGNPVTLDNVDYFVLQGGHDGDVSIFLGTRQYQRSKLSGSAYHFKTELFIYRANHGQFNTGWGNNNFGGPLGRILNFKALMSGDDQRKVAKVYISAFLEATLRRKSEYLPMFQDYRPIESWLPDGIYLNRFRDSNFKLISDFEEDADPGTTTVPGGVEEGHNLKVWKEEKLPLRGKGGPNQANNVVRLGWEKLPDGGDPDQLQAVYRITLPDAAVKQWAITPLSRLSFALANASDGSDPVGITIELATASTTASLPLSQFAPVDPPLTVRFSKIGLLESRLLNPSEIVPHNYELSLQEFINANPQFDPAKLKAITLAFDRSREGSIVLDDIGLQ
ncbi:MAG TPA: alpha/beta hydrolase [Blastocatellia bacterium]|nr:alpha/beta hydrolase [Blastocatellia bacterium]